MVTLTLIILLINISLSIVDCGATCCGTVPTQPYFKPANPIFIIIDARLLAELAGGNGYWMSLPKGRWSIICALSTRSYVALLCKAIMQGPTTLLPY